MEMDVNTLRTVLTVCFFLMFVAIVVWAWSSPRQARFAEAARVPLEDDGVPPRR
jgi:cytochrome c oxidase cbb3-type subunit 4